MNLSQNLIESVKRNLSELSNELLARYKSKSGAQASDLDKTSDKANIDKATSRFKGIVKATNKQFKNDSTRVL